MIWQHVCHRIWCFLWRHVLENASLYGEAQTKQQNSQAETTNKRIKRQTNPHRRYNQIPGTLISDILKKLQPLSKIGPSTDSARYASTVLSNLTH